MKHFFFIASFVLAISFAGNSQTKNFIDQPYIEVNGTADSLVTPNQIFIKIVLSEKDTKDKVSVEQLESKMVAALKSLGINTEKDLTASDMLSNYKSYLLKQKDILKTKEYMLKVTTAAMASKVLLQLENLDISNTAIDHVDHSDLDGLKNACRVKAIENAKAKAVALTKPLEQSVGNAILIISNDINYENQPRMYSMSVRSAKAMDAGSYEPPQIDFEKIKVNATVNVTFILK